MKADLHMHSTYSDGLLTTREVLNRAKQNGVDLIAITDHDIVKNVEDNTKYAKEIGIDYIPGIELSTVMDGKPVHVLGYFTDESYRNKDITDYFLDIKLRREERARKFVANLKTFFDIDINYEDVLKLSNGIIARPHIAKAVTLAYPQYDHDYVFNNFIGDSSEAYVPSCELSVQEGIDLLRKNNCLVVLAHPVLLKDFIKERVLSLEFDGIEAKYLRNAENDESTFREFAKTRGMIITGGSDFHGIKNDTKHGDIGDVFIDSVDFEHFMKAYKAKKRNK